MTRKFYVALQGTAPYVFASWEECKNFQAQHKGVLVKAFESTDTAVSWVKSKGGVLTDEDFPAYLFHNEPVLSEPVVIAHDRSLVPKSYVRIYTDGSCLSNPGGPGGFGAVILLPGGSEIHISGREASTTSNRMELMAALSALDYISRNKLTEGIREVTVFTDSRYLRNIFEKQWIMRWLSNGWRTSSDKPVLNKDLLEILDWLVSDMPVRFIWVQSHNNNRFNELADSLAGREAKKAAKSCGFFSKPVKKGFTKPKKTADTAVKAKYKPVNTNKRPVVRQGPVNPAKPEPVKNTGFVPGYTTVSVGRLRIRNRATKKMPGNTMRNMVIHMNLLNGDKVILPLSDKQLDVISLVLGIAGEAETGIRLFDDKTLEDLLSCKTNPLRKLWEIYKKPVFD